MYGVAFSNQQLSAYATVAASGTIGPQTAYLGTLADAGIKIMNQSPYYLALLTSNVNVIDNVPPYTF